MRRSSFCHAASLRPTCYVPLRGALPHPSALPSCQARIEHDKEHAQARMDRIEAKVDGLSSSLQRIEKLLASAPEESPLNNPLLA